MARFSPSLFPLAAGFLAAVSLGMLAVMGLRIEPAFHALTGLSIPDLRLGGYETADVKALIAALAQSPEAAAMLRGMHLGADLAFPLAYGLLCLMLLARFAPGATVFHKPVAGIRLVAMLAMPVLYMAADYVENIASLMLFPPALPAPDRLALLTDLLPLATRAKAMLFFISLILVLRFTLFREAGKTNAGA